MRVKTPIILALLFLSLLPCPAGADFYGLFKYSTLSVRKLKLEPQERVVSFKLKLKGAYIYSLPVLPHDWSMEVGNFTHSDPPWDCEVTGAASHQSGAVEGDYFKDFMVIGVFKPGYHCVAKHYELELEITAELDHTQRKLVFHAKDMVYKPFMME